MFSKKSSFSISVLCGFTSTTGQSSTFHQTIFVSIFEPCQKGRGRKWEASLTDGIHSVVSTKASRVGWRKRRPKPRKCHNCSQGGLKHLLAQAAVPAPVYGRDLHVTMKAALKAAKATLPCFPHRAFIGSSLYRPLIISIRLSIIQEFFEDQNCGRGPKTWNLLKANSGVKKFLEFSGTKLYDKNH